MSIYDNKVYKGGHHAGLRAAATPFRRDWHRAQVIAQIDPKTSRPCFCPLMKLTEQ